jgi:hypothetical protein
MQPFFTIKKLSKGCFGRIATHMGISIISYGKKSWLTNELSSSVKGPLYNETNVMHFSFSLLRIRVSLCFEHYLLILRRRNTNGTWYIAWCQLAATRNGVKLLSSTPTSACVAPPEDKQVMLRTCRVHWFSINWMKSASRWLNYTDKISLLPHSNQPRGHSSYYSMSIRSCSSQVIWPEREVGQSPTPLAKVKNDWSYTAVPNNSQCAVSSWTEARLILLFYFYV